MRIKVVVQVATAALAIVAVAALARANDVADGHKYYQQYCASCHGENADGRGPAAKALKTPPADLRVLWVKFGKPLPAAQIGGYIDGRNYVAAHGNREMPVWGERFYDIWEAKQEGAPDMTQRIELIVNYLNSIQVKPGPISSVPSPTATSGPAATGQGH